MYVLVLVPFYHVHVIFSNMHVLVLVYVLLPVLDALRERNTQHYTGHVVHTAPCTIVSTHQVCYMYVLILQCTC